MKKNRRYTAVVTFALALVLLPQICLAGISRGGERNTNQGVDALHNNVSNNTAGSDNSAFGYQALYSNTTGNFNTAAGSQALFSSSIGNFNTALGYQALFSINDAGVPGVGMTAVGYQAAYSTIETHGTTAVGYQALFSNTTGFGNTAVGWESLAANTTGSQNSGCGVSTLQSNTTGSRNTATGNNTLGLNTTGSFNTADGQAALDSNTTGNSNTATGRAALLSNTTGNQNTADGAGALVNNTTGNSNIALGSSAGANLDVGSNNIDIANTGISGESNTIRIGDPATQNAAFVAGIFGSGTDVAGVPVFVDATGKLGTLPSSQRFKHDIVSIGNASESIFSLRPVTFHYDEKISRSATPQFGLVAEEVAKVNPDLVVRDGKGEIYSVRYEAVNAMLLNEFLKEHRKVQELEKQVENLTAGLQQVRDEVELKKEAPRVVANR